MSSRLRTLSILLLSFQYSIYPFYITTLFPTREHNHHVFVNDCFCLSISVLPTHIPNSELLEISHDMQPFYIMVFKS